MNKHWPYIGNQIYDALICALRNLGAHGQSRFCFWAFTVNMLALLRPMSPLYLRIQGIIM